jgi:hypothetical protein
MVDMEIYITLIIKIEKERKILTKLFLVDDCYVVSSSERCDCDVVCEDDKHVLPEYTLT